MNTKIDEKSNFSELKGLELKDLYFICSEYLSNESKLPYHKLEYLLLKYMKEYEITKNKDIYDKIEKINKIIQNFTSNDYKFIILQMIRKNLLFTLSVFLASCYPNFEILKTIVRTALIHGKTNEIKIIFSKFRFLDYLDIYIINQIVLSNDIEKFEYIISRLYNFKCCGVCYEDLSLNIIKLKEKIENTKFDKKWIEIINKHKMPNKRKNTISEFICISLFSFAFASSLILLGANYIKL